MGWYNREEALAYAKKWAFGRNPIYYNFDPVGGDCTSFISQCLYAGSKVMNYSQYGWYYKSGYDKSPSWSGVEYLYNFLVNNKGSGPYAREENLNNLELADIIQLSFDGIRYMHSLIITKIEIIDNRKHIFIASHTDDSYNRDIETYGYTKARGIRIEGVRA